MTYRFRGAKIGEQECPTCNGNTRVFVFSCRLHGSCTEVKPLWPEVDGRYRVCMTCHDRDACVGSGGKAEWLLRNIQRTRNLASVPRLTSAPNADCFIERYWSTLTPVVFPVDTPAWTFPELRIRFGGVQVEIQSGRDGDPDYESRSYLHKSTVGFSDFLTRVETEPSNDFYMTANNAGTNRDALRPMLNETKPIDGIITDPANAFVWISPAGAITPTHHDLTSNLLVQVLGRKRVLMVPPEWTPLMQNHLHVYSRVDLSAPKVKVPIIEVEIGPGDAMFLPIGWWHHVTTLEPSIMLSYTNFAGVRNDFYSDHPAISS